MLQFFPQSHPPQGGTTGIPAQGSKRTLLNGILAEVKHPVSQCGVPAVMGGKGREGPVLPIHSCMLRPYNQLYD